MSQETGGSVMISNKVYNAIPDATLFCTIILALLLDRYYPVIKIIPFPVNLLGWLVVLTGVCAAIHLLATLRANRTSTDATGTPSEFLTRGFYAFSRNPFYLAYVVIVAGVAFILGSLMAFAAPLFCFAVIHFMIIPLEERNLQKRFGQEYTVYKQSVRRWV